MARGRPYRFARFARGLNVADGPYGLREGFEDDPSGLGAEARAVLNVVSRRRGNVSRREGCAKLADTGSAATWKDLSTIGNDATSFALGSTSGGVLFALSSSLVRTQLATGLSTTAPWTFLRLPVIAAQGAAFGMNGVDTPRETDGTLAGTGNWTAVSGTLKNGSLLEYHENTLWVAGVSAEPYSLFWSSPGDPTAWPAANVTKFNPDGGLPITALRSTGPYLLVFKERGIWSVYNAETSANRKFTDSAGTLSPRSVVSTPEGTFFLDPEQGVMVTDGNQVKRVSAQIQPLLDKITATDLPLVTAAYAGRHLYVSASIDGVKYVLDFDVELGSWWVHTPAVTALGVWDRGNDLDLVGTVGADIWQLFKSGELQDNGATFESYWSGPYHTFGAAHLRKRCRRIHVDGRGTFAIFVAKDYSPALGELEDQADFSAAAGSGLFGGAGTFGAGAGTFGGGGDVGEAEVYSLGVGRAWSLTAYSSAASSWELDAYSMLMDVRKA